MSDNKKYTGKKDRIRIDPNDPSEVEKLHAKYPMFTHRQVLNAIKKYGPMRKDVKKYMDKRSINN